jgi:hypothetical protein
MFQHLGAIAEGVCLAETKKAAGGLPSWSTPPFDLGRLAHGAVLLVELLDPARRVDDLLLAGVEGMAGRTDLDVQCLFIVDRVVKSLPQEQVTVISLYAG